MSGQSSGEKTEQPTPKKVRDAREKGQVARSQEVVTTISLFAVIAYLWASFDLLVDKMVVLFSQAAQLSVMGDFRTSAGAGIFLTAKEVALVLLPVIGITVIAGIAANYFQFGSVFSFESIMPKLEKISPGAGFKRLFSMKSLIELLKSVLKIIFLSVLLYYVIRGALGGFLSSVACGMPCLTQITGIAITDVLLYSLLAFLIVAAADFAYQRYSFTKSLMMTKDEVHREYKESEGDPHIKGHRRQLAQELAMGDGPQAARSGTALVVNPTHFAVVLSYKPEERQLPIVTAKGRNLQAYRLREAAEEAGVPIFRNVLLARALFADAEINAAVPDEFFDAVAEVLAWVTKNQALLYGGRLDHGVIDMDAGDHRVARGD